MMFPQIDGVVFHGTPCGCCSKRFMLDSVPSKRLEDFRSELLEQLERVNLELNRERQEPDCEDARYVEVRP